MCPWLVLTGQYCPGCGSLRAVNDLTHGDLVGAAGSNLLFVMLVPVVVLWWLGWARRAWTGSERTVRAMRHRGVWVAVGTAGMLAFAVLRNMPAGAWLAP